MTDASAEKAVYLDANFFIRAVEGTDDVVGPPRALLETLRRRHGVGVTSEITFAETLAPPARDDALPLHVKRRVYLDMLLWSGFIKLVPISRDILIETADLRSVSRMKLPDAIHLVSAIRSRCRYIVSGDKDFNKVPDGMTWVNLNQTGVDTVLEFLA